MQFNSLLAVIVVLPAVLAQGTNWSQSCSGGFLTGSGPSLSLQAVCKTNSGANHTTTLGLSSCLGNSNGNLICQRGGAAFQSCGSCSLGVPNLTCNCPTTSGAGHTTTINTNNCIGNQNGNLFC
ncbi:Cyanovirin-N [Exidia glandulosa HHB12029]|uniref:Cyanovirin-N n=1 Tax=Exidia glandulosa HHB12029 TaxID=1314781 RepID=A0A165PJ27_EXIGL|nr:Cyanovirin-N [Exidia glandulosa HHB12029]KZW02248.1 Cyanovirin-N [Exidia glandulosa HHB12029]